MHSSTHGHAPFGERVVGVLLLALLTLGCASAAPDDTETGERHPLGEWDLHEPSLGRSGKERAAEGPQKRRPQLERISGEEDRGWLTRPPKERVPRRTEPPEEERPPGIASPGSFAEWDLDEDWMLGERVDISGADRTILVRIVGNRALSDAVLREAAADALRDLEALPAPRLEGFERQVREAAIAGYRRQIRAITDDAAHLMQRHYESLGYYWARTDVTWSFDEQEPRFATVTFRVLREEPRVRLDEVEFYGVDAFDPNTLTDLFGTPGAILFGQTYYVESVVEQARADLLAMYRQAGYLRAEVQVHKPRTERQWSWSTGRTQEVPPDRARVIVEVNEGRLYRLAEIRLRLPGFEDFAPKPPGLKERLEPFLNEPYRRADHVLLLAEIKEFYQNRGHAHVQMGEEEAQIDDGRGQVTVVVHLDPGRVYTIGNIEVESESLSVGFLRRILPLREGDLYRVSSERAAYRQLVRTNVVRMPTIEIVRTNESAAEVDLSVRVDEIPSLELRPYVGWGSYEQLRGSLSLAEHNLFGAARVMSMEVGASFKSEWAELTFTDPWTLGGVVPYSLSGFYQRREEPDFTRQEIGVKFSLRHAFSRQLDMSLFYQYVDSRAFDLEDPLIDAREFEVKLGTLSLRTEFATVADRLSPVEGMVHTLNLNLSAEPIGSTVDFARLRLQSVFFLPIDKEARLVLALRYMGEVNLPFGDTEAGDIPVQERIYNGGATTVRSFEHHALRRFRNSEAIGGQGRNVATLELRFPLLAEAGFDGALFADAGNLAESLAGYFNHWSFGLGFGLRYLTPVGPARLDVAWSPMPRHDEDRWHIHFWIGYPF